MKVEGGIDAAVAKLRAIAATRDAYPDCLCPERLMRRHLPACRVPLDVQGINATAALAHAEHEDLLARTRKRPR